MKDRDTSLGGFEKGFPTTMWNRVLAPHDLVNPDRKEKLAEICERYWKPIYLYIRRAWGKSNEEAKDLAQDFFVKLLEEDLLSKYQSERGRFRSFLKTCLRNFLSNQQRSERVSGRQKICPVSLQARENEWDRLSTLAATETLSPEDLFDREWARVLMESALDEVRKELKKEGKEKYFDAYSDCVLNKPEGASGTYRETAARLGLEEHDISNYISRVRVRVREAIRLRIADTVTSEEGLLVEMRELFSF